MTLRKWTLISCSFLILWACQSSVDQLGSVVESDGEIITDATENPSFTPDEELQRFFDDKMSDQQVFFQGTVIKNLADDNEGSRHQKFLVELNSGQTLLISHNIDLAPRIDALREGDEVKIYGEYEWNERGGVVHWTHHDPQNIHVGGWIEHNDQFYD